MSRTIFLARLLGLYCLVVALSMFTHRQATVGIVTAMVHSEAQLFMIGLVGVACGLALVLGHNVWSGGVLPVIVTVVSWLSLIKGVALLFLSPASASVFFLETLRYDQFFYGYVSLTFALGIFLVAMTLHRRATESSVTTETDFSAMLTHSK